MDAAVKALAAPASYAVRGSRCHERNAVPRFGKTGSDLVPLKMPRDTVSHSGRARLGLRVQAIGVGDQKDVKVEPRRSMAQSAPAQVAVDNDSNENYTIVTVRAGNRPGLLKLITATFGDLGLDVGRAVVDMGLDGSVQDAFFVTGAGGKKVTERTDLEHVQKCLLDVLNHDAYKLARGGGSRSGGATRPVGGHYERAVHENLSPVERRRTELLYGLMDQYIRNDVLSIQKSIVDHVEYTVARSRYKFDDFEAYQGTAYSVRDRLIESWNDTQQYFKDQDPKRVYYLSLEFLMGRSLLNSIFNLGIRDQYSEALSQLGYSLETLAQQERDAALGNGGLGRLAACFLDSIASLNYPGWGYGIRYQYGMFRQTLRDGFQHEQPDYWLTFGNPWEIERVHVSYPVRFFGSVEEYTDAGRKRMRWVQGERVEAVAYDNPIPGYRTNNTINLRLWAAKPSGEFDLESFNTGDYVTGILSKQRAETISSVLYPDDRTYQGKELRLKQQHFFVSATLQDIVRRYKDQHGNFDDFANKVAIQLNDTHPAVGVPELMRILIDDEGLDWSSAWEKVQKVFSFTNHTVLPEYLEKWPVELMQTVLPRHLQIIYDINYNFLEELKKRIGNDYSRLARMSIIEEGEHKAVRMATLAVVASHAVNGVAVIHSELIKNVIFKDFYDLFPFKFQNKTNGVTQRRWLAFSNPGLGKVISNWLGTEAWITDLDLLAGLRQHASDPLLQRQWTLVRRQNKARLADYIETMTGVKVSIDAMFDIQVKRIHAYKRQLLNMLGIIHRYDCIKSMTPEERRMVVPRVCVLGGKAAPGYDFAKALIKLICTVGDRINNDPDIGNLLKLVFIPDYNVSVAELIIPASDLSQHISLAGNEASGTSNMKQALNGCLILGTLDGANVEIQEEIGAENMFIFGVKSDEVKKLRTERRAFLPCKEFTRVVEMIRNGYFGWPDVFAPLCDAVDGAGGDHYLLANDFPGYLEAQARVDRSYVEPARWARMSILSTAGTGKFSSDRTIKEYAEEIWDIRPCNRPL